ncbi:hypothetical protein BGZ68_008949 [Mortierella alpina]|nr:hypothetical protein BGZ68_008949 [Mortierella alpina]
MDLSPLNAVRTMLRIDLKVKNLRDFEVHIRKSDVSNEDVGFADWFLREITDKPNIAKSFYSTRFQLDVANEMHVILSLGFDELLNDDAIMAVLLFFQRVYGSEGSLFLAPTYLLYGGQWDYGKENLHRSNRIFAVIHMEEYVHWGVACFDLRQRTIAFGDSLEPREVVNWLKSLTGPEMWDDALANVKRFKISQPQDGVSCGIMATVAIEQTVRASSRIRSQIFFSLYSSFRFHQIPSR